MLNIFPQQEYSVFGVERSGNPWPTVSLEGACGARSKEQPGGYPGNWGAGCFRGAAGGPRGLGGPSLLPEGAGDRGGRGEGVPESRGPGVTSRVGLNITFLAPSGL